MSARVWCGPIWLMPVLEAMLAQLRQHDLTVDKLNKLASTRSDTQAALEMAADRSAPAFRLILQ